MTARTEAIEAARWWAAQLGHAEHDNGDGLQSAMMTFATAQAAHSYTNEQRETFRAHLADTIEEHLQRWGSWDPAEPSRGSALRAFGIDYGADKVLADAADRAGVKLTMFDLPIKTTMWVNPGEVKVSAGYRAPIVTIWPCAGDAP